MKRKSKYHYIDKEMLAEAYEKCGRSISKTATHFGMAVSNMFYKFQDLGVEYDKNIKHSCNHNYFDNLNEHQMYWLGFLLTDGCIQEGRNRLLLELASKDIYIIEQFKKDLEFSGPIYTGTKNVVKDEITTSFYTSGVRITSKQICDRLAEFGIVPRKTYTAKFPELLKGHKLVNHFIRGCIDGDGWIMSIGNGNRITVGFCGTKELVEGLAKTIYEETNINIDGKIKFQSGCTWVFGINASRDTATLVKWLYKDATIYLPRKYDIAMNIIEYEKQHLEYDPNKEQLEKDLDECSGIVGIMKKHNVGYKKVKEKLLDFDIEHKTSEYNEYNINFFSNDNKSEAKYYWAGHLAATCGINEEKKSIGWSSTNKQHIESFIRDSNMNINIWMSGNNRYHTSINNDTIFDQLTNIFHMNDQKYMKYIIPNWILNDPMLKHFLRGYFDARSGMIYEDKRNRTRFVIHNNKEFIDQVLDILKRACSLEPTSKIHEYHNGKRGIQYKIAFSQTQTIIIWSWLYSDATIFLPERRALFDRAVVASGQ